MRKKTLGDLIEELNFVSAPEMVVVDEFGREVIDVDLNYTAVRRPREFLEWLGPRINTVNALRDKKVNAVKYVRAEGRLGLKEAKYFVDWYFLNIYDQDDQ